MAWRAKRTNNDGPGAGDALEVFSQGNGLVVQGDLNEVTAFVDHLLQVTDEAGGNSTKVLLDGMQIAANLTAVIQTHRQFIEFSPRAMDLLKTHGAIPTQDGYFRSFVRHGRLFAGNLDWKSVNLSPEQALGMQALAGQLALRAAVKEITAAIERVEGKVDQLVTMVEAERTGEVIADRTLLLPLIEQVRSGADLSDTDWESIAGLGSQIARVIETLRNYVSRQIKEVKAGALVRSRAGEAEDLTERFIKEAVALLVVAEDNFSLWLELKLARGTDQDPYAVLESTKVATKQLDAMNVRDQQLATALQEVTDRLGAPTGYEGLAPLKKQQLQKHIRELDELSSWFCEQRHLDSREVTRPELAKMADSLKKVGDNIADGARATKSALADVSGRLLKRIGDDDEEDTSPELNP